MSEHRRTKQIWSRLVEYSSAEVSDPSEVPRINGKLIFKLVKEVKLSLRALDNIVLVRTSTSLVRNIDSLIFFEKSTYRTRFTLVVRETSI